MPNTKLVGYLRAGGAGGEQGIFNGEGASIHKVCEGLAVKNNAAIAPLPTP